MNQNFFKQYISTLGTVDEVDFETAIKNGFASDGGLFVPKAIPKIKKDELERWSELEFVELASEILSLYIDESLINRDDLIMLLNNSYNEFSHPKIAPVRPLGDKDNQYVLELFHGPTLSFKDMAMGFLVNCLDYFLAKKNEHISLLLATTGDTGPAAAYASKGKKTIDCWILYPKGFISEEQERQITTLEEENIHAVGVYGCKDGGDDLDLVISEFFSNEKLKNSLSLSSVNSINWCRVLVQSIHYFYAYFQVTKDLEERIVFSVPTGACGNLFGGYLARAMGLPIESFISSNNVNAVIHNILKKGVFSKVDLQQTFSSAIDIVVPYNVWRWLYFASGCDSSKIRSWTSNFKTKGYAKLDQQTLMNMKQHFSSEVITDAETLETMNQIYAKYGNYLLDPHSAVAVAGAYKARDRISNNIKIISLATAHPAKFPKTIIKALNTENLPSEGSHYSIKNASEFCQNLRTCQYKHLSNGLIRSMTKVCEKRNQL